MGEVARIIVQLRERLKPAGGVRDEEFLPPADEIAATPASPVRMAFLLSICALFVIALLVSWIGEIDIYAVAPGRIQPSGRSKVVQPTEAGRIRAIYVQNGAAVRAGALLAMLDPTEAAADRTSLAGQVAALDAEIARRRAAIARASAAAFTAAPVAFPADVDKALAEREETVLEADLGKLKSALDVSRAKIAEDTAKKRALFATIAANRHVAATQAERMHMRQSLAAQGWESRASVLDASEELEKEDVSLASERGEVDQLDAETATLNDQIADSVSQFVSDNAQALAEAERKRDQQAEDLVKASAKLKRTALTAPIDGTVQELSVTTVGQVVSAGQQLMTIVPRHGVLEVEALVKNEDIGFVKPGAAAVIKIDAFPFTRYGTISGIVKSVSHELVDEHEARQSGDTQQTPVSPQSSASAPTPEMQGLVFPVVIELDRRTISADGEVIALSPGMSVSAEIRTGRRRVIDYLLSPLSEVTSDAAHER